MVAWLLSVRPVLGHYGPVNDIEELTRLNVQFIDAFRKGSWEVLEPILAPGFRYLSGSTGKVEELPEYVTDLQTNPSPGLEIDQVVIHVDGDSAVVSARCTSDKVRYSRYVDSYHRDPARGWICFHACVWPLKAAGS